MASYNKVIIAGNLCRDVELRYTPGGAAVTEVTLAVNSTRFDKKLDKKIEECSFVDVTMWGRTAEIAGEYLSKGSNILIEGRLQEDQWDDKETGKKRSKLKVVAENMTMLGSKKDKQDDRESGGSGTHSPASSGADLADAPF